MKFTEFDVSQNVSVCLLVIYLPHFFIFQVATRAAFGTSLMKLAKNNDRVIAFDGDTKNSTFSEKIKVSSVSVPELRG